MVGFGELFQQAGRIREEIQKIQESMGGKTVEASVGGGMVKVVASGKQEIVSITIDPEMAKMNDREMLQDLVTSGVNEALKAARDMVAEEMKKLTGGLGPFASLLKGL